MTLIVLVLESPSDCDMLYGTISICASIFSAIDTDGWLESLLIWVKLQE